MKFLAPLKRWANSANHAIEGIITAAKTQRHLRYHLYVAAAVILFSYTAGVTKVEFLIISLVVLCVITAEMLNTAMEFMVNILSPEKREEARIAKDVAAGSVLVVAFGAMVIGYIILFPYLVVFFQKGVHIAGHRGDDVAVLALIMVTIIVILLKAFFGKGHPLRGGMPSGHAALFFSIWMSATFMTKNLVISILTFLAAGAVAQSRVSIKVHTIWEVILGALIGSGITFVLFKIFAS